MPGYCFSRSSTNARTLGPWALTSSTPLVNFRSGVGTRTRTLINGLPTSICSPVRRTEMGQKRYKPSTERLQGAMADLVETLLARIVLYSIRIPRCLRISLASYRLKWHNAGVTYFKGRLNVILRAILQENFVF